VPSETLLSDAEIFAVTKRCIDAWNSLDLEATLATYSDDVVYRDPGSGEQINGKADLRRYLAKFFETWNMQFRVLEDRRIAGADAQVCLWEVDVTRAGGDGRSITVMGMDIIHVRNGQLTRDEAFVDRLPLQELL
jgi:steroid delta-isomerase-like uncharacterized protein